MEWLLSIFMSLLNPKPPAERYKDRNPVVVVHETAEDARKAAYSEASGLKGRVYRTVGTPSMEPFITGQVYVIGVPKPYDQLQQGEIANYRPKFANGSIVIHRLIQKDKGGWIGSGDNNRWSESNERIKQDNYLDHVVKIHTYKGAEKTRVKK